LNVTGIIAEYNPFHQGHQYHLEESRRITQADCVVAVMSGDFTQRGEPTVLDKWTRAATAVENGVDLVLEMPFVFACNNAEYFAHGGIAVLAGLGCVTHFCFGSEQGDINRLVQAAKILSLETDDFRERIRHFLDLGYSYPKARYEAMAVKNADEASVLLSPNNILGVEYLKQWLSIPNDMQPVTIKREGAGYHDQNLKKGKYPSASGIRKFLAETEDRDLLRSLVPEKTFLLMKEKPLLFHAALYPLIFYKILTSERQELAAVLSAGEGLENRLKEALKDATDLEDLIRRVKSKRYTETRICRLLVHTLLDLKKDVFFRFLEEDTLYARVLAFSGRGAELLRQVKKKEQNKIPIITNINKDIAWDSPLREMLSYDVLASDLCNLLRYGEMGRHSDHICRPYQKP